MKLGGIVRGAVYVLVPAITIMSERAASYVDKPPVSSWEYVALCCSAAVASLTALRAYLDQHLSRTEEPLKQ